MPKFDNVIKRAIEQAVEKDGSQAALCKKTGISTSIMSRYLRGEVENITLGTWNLLVPAIQEFLPEQYQRTFMTWKCQEAWEQFGEQNPEAYRYLSDYHNNLNIKSMSDPLYGAPKEKIHMVETIKEILQYGQSQTLKKILQLLWVDEEIYKENMKEGTTNAKSREENDK